VEDDFGGGKHSLLEDFGMREVARDAVEQVFNAFVFFSKKSVISLISFLLALVEFSEIFLLFQINNLTKNLNSLYFFFSYGFSIS